MLNAALATFVVNSNPLDSPFSVPVAGCLMVFGIVAVSIWSGVRQREIQSAERLAAIAKGITPPPSDAELAVSQGRPSADASRRRGNVRRGGIVCVGLGVGLVLFFIALTVIVQTREVLAGAAAGLIPLGIGVALLIDARLQSREIAAAAQQPLLSQGRELSL